MQPGTSCFAFKIFPRVTKARKTGLFFHDSIKVFGFRVILKTLFCSHHIKQLGYLQEHIRYETKGGCERTPQE